MQQDKTHHKVISEPLRESTGLASALIRNQNAFSSHMGDFYTAAINIHTLQPLQK